MSESPKQGAEQPPSRDEALAARLASGDAEALTPLVERWQRPLGIYIRRRCYSCRDEIDDLLQEVFLRVFQNIREFDAGLSFSAWIYRITHNLMVSRIRSHGARGTPVAFDDELFPSTRFRSDARVEQGELQRLLQQVELKLPEKLRDVFILRFQQELDYSEIADILRENENTIATRIRRAREKFIAEASLLGLQLHLED